MKRQVLFLYVILFGMVVSAHDFSLMQPNKQSLYFNITDTIRCYVELTYPNSITNPQAWYAGDLEIPQFVTYNNKNYQVTAVGQKAFSGCALLKSVVFPSGLTKIGDFAFEDCISLKRVMMPGNSVELGAGAFFRCSNIASLTIGSDWTEFNLKPFRWSDKIEEINLPARIGKIENLNTAKGLKKITVDANNNTFASVNGMLYTKDGATLLACPRAVADTVEIAEGTETIRWGALINCGDITHIVLPKSLKVLSYKEFSRMKQLKQIVMKAEKPLETAETNGKKVFLLTVANPQTTLVVGKNFLKSYKAACATESGDYKELVGNLPKGIAAEHALIPHVVRIGDILMSANFYGTKDFSITDISKLKK